MKNKWEVNYVPLNKYCTSIKRLQPSTIFTADFFKTFDLPVFAPTATATSGGPPQSRLAINPRAKNAEIEMSHRRDQRPWIFAGLCVLMASLVATGSLEEFPESGLISSEWAAAGTRTPRSARSARRGERVTAGGGRWCQLELERLELTDASVVLSAHLLSVKFEQS